MASPFFPGRRFKSWRHQAYRWDLTRALTPRCSAFRSTKSEESWRIRKDGSRFWADVVVTAVLLLCSVLAAATHGIGTPGRMAIALLFILLSVRLGAISIDDLRILAPRWPTR